MNLILNFLKNTLRNVFLKTFGGRFVTGETIFPLSEMVIIS